MRRGLAFGALFLLAAQVVSAIETPLLGMAGIRPLFEGLMIGTLASVILATLIYDFFYYWLHRAQHRFPILWRFHAVHHSVRKLSPATSFHHISEALFRGIFVAIPVTMFAPPGTPGYLMIAIVAHGYYLHSSTRANFGWFAYVINDNRNHRIHHSVDPRHHNRNFGVTTPLWDRLFGTFHYPDTWCAVGLEDYPEPQTIRDYIRGHSGDQLYSQMTIRPSEPSPPAAAPPVPLLAAPPPPAP